MGQIYNEMSLIDSSSSEKLILITNDDGVNAPGIRVLAQCLNGLGHIVIVAPEDAQSGKASAITVNMPLRIREVERQPSLDIFAVSGTPVDCVKLAMHAILDRTPDYMASGINHGSNSGNSVIYSGTMGAVLESCMLGITSVGFSLTHSSIKADFGPSEKFVRQISEMVMSEGLGRDVCLNVNIPARCTPRGIKVCRASMGHWTDEYVRYEDPSKHPFYMLSGTYVDEDKNDNTTDNYWLAREYVTVVPVRPDQTDNEQILNLAQRVCKIQ